MIVIGKRGLWEPGGFYNSADIIAEVLVPVGYAIKPLNILNWPDLPEFILFH